MTEYETTRGRGFDDTGGWSASYIRQDFINNFILFLTEKQHHRLCSSTQLPPGAGGGRHTRNW
jgi:hypothetical protein